MSADGRRRCPRLRRLQRQCSQPQRLLGYRRYGHRPDAVCLPRSPASLEQASLEGNAQEGEEREEVGSDLAR